MEGARGERGRVERGRKMWGLKEDKVKMGGGI